MLQSSNDITGGQRFSIKVTEKEVPTNPGGATTRVFEASTKNAPDLGTVTASTSQSAVRAFSDRLARYVANGYDAKKALAAEPKRG